jgi:energy-converting hydrogenase A subunit J
MIAELVLATLFGLLLLGIHRKLIARIQRRPGPPVWQEILHMLKFSFKTTWIPVTASRTLFVAVVLIAMVSGLQPSCSSVAEPAVILGIYAP